MIKRLAIIMLFSCSLQAQPFLPPTMLQKIIDFGRAVLLQKAVEAAKSKRTRETAKRVVKGAAKAAKEKGFSCNIL